MHKTKLLVKVCSVVLKGGRNMVIVTQDRKRMVFDAREIDIYESNVVKADYTNDKTVRSANPRF